jgi:hypothetical protein
MMIRESGSRPRVQSSVRQRLREVVRGEFFSLLKRPFATDDGKRILTGALGGLLAGHPAAPGHLPAELPYPELGRAGTSARPNKRSDAVIITGRFRSGSTLLWNLFRQAGGFTAYYEPLNERQWFDPTLRGDHTDPSHRNASEYWREYDGLGVLRKYYRVRWIDRDLYMDRRFDDPDLRGYVDTLIAEAPGRPALQFNRIDFRLPWFRAHYPNATLVHVFRNPRDQWCSTLMGDLDRFTKDGHVAGFAPYDRFYLLSWARDLKYHFPFLDERRVRHPYQLFYYLWYLSLLFAREHCDHSVQFERLIAEPADEIGKLFRTLGVEAPDAEGLSRLVDRPPTGKWTRYADDGWFKDHEAECEEVITDFLAVAPACQEHAAGAGRRAEGRS